MPHVPARYRRPHPSAAGAGRIHIEPGDGPEAPAERRRDRGHSRGCRSAIPTTSRWPSKCANAARSSLPIGDCATFGGVPAMRNLCGTEAALNRAYLETESTVGGLIPDSPELGKPLDEVVGVDKVVKVDLFIPGCPPERRRPVLRALGAARRAHADRAAAPIFQVRLEEDFHECS